MSRTENEEPVLSGLVMFLPYHCAILNTAPLRLSQDLLAHERCTTFPRPSFPDSSFLPSYPVLAVARPSLQNTQFLLAT